MRRRNIAGLTLAATLALVSSGCQVILLEDLVVSWTIDGGSAPALCTTYGIADWNIKVEGINLAGRTVPCSSSWSATFAGLEEGLYRVTVTALDNNGAVLAKREDANFPLNAAGPSPDHATVNFAAQDFSGGNPVCGNKVCEANETPTSCPTDCSGGGGGKINIFWNINGTVDGTPTGRSWDTCAEVGADKVLVKVDGVESQHPCDAAGNMSTTIASLEANKDYALKVSLLDSAGKPLTTEASATVKASVAGSQYVADFFHDSFYEPKKTGIKGDFIFKTTYEGKICSGTTPAVEYQVTLLKLKGGSTVTGAQVCDKAGSKCDAADGSATSARVCSDGEQKIPDQVWGAYMLKLQGAIDDKTASGLVCWEKEREILVGAGTDNPLFTFDVDRLSGVTCTP